MVILFVDFAGRMELWLFLLFFLYWINYVWVNWVLGSVSTASLRNWVLWLVYRRLGLEFARIKVKVGALHDCVVGWLCLFEGMSQILVLARHGLSLIDHRIPLNLFAWPHSWMVRHWLCHHLLLVIDLIINIRVVVVELLMHLLAAIHELLVGDFFDRAASLLLHSCGYRFTSIEFIKRFIPRLPCCVIDRAAVHRKLLLLLHTLICLIRQLHASSMVWQSQLTKCWLVKPLLGL